jgi:two-component system, LytTR family, response regulator
MKLRALIADDEPLARERLRHLLSRDSDIEIGAECRNGREVMSALKGASFDVLFLDIQMPGRDGFEVIGELGAATMPITVFVTAHNQYALQAFEVNALDYLTKPVEMDRLQNTLARVRERRLSQTALSTKQEWMTTLAGLEQLLNSRKDYPQRLLVPNGSNKDSIINVDDIDWIEAADYYACLHVANRRFMLRQPIKDLAETLDPLKFVRIQRSAIVNVNRVSEIFHEGRNDGSVVLVNGDRIRMSKTGWQALLAIHGR